MNENLAAIEEFEAYGKGQRVAFWSIVLSAGLAAIKITSGRRGMTMKLSTMVETVRSKAPPR